MATYSVAEARDNLSRLIDEACVGDQVIVTRHGRPVAEIRAVARPNASGRSRTIRDLASRALPYVEGAPDSVELLRRVYEDEA